MRIRPVQCTDDDAGGTCRDVAVRRRDIRAQCEGRSACRAAEEARPRRDRHRRCVSVGRNSARTQRRWVCAPSRRAPHRRRRRADTVDRRYRCSARGAGDDVGRRLEDSAHAAAAGVARTCNGSRARLSDAAADRRVAPGRARIAGDRCGGGGRIAPRVSGAQRGDGGARCFRRRARGTGGRRRRPRTVRARS